MVQPSWPSGMQEKPVGSLIPVEGIIVAFPTTHSVSPVLPALPNALFYKLLGCPPSKSNLELVQLQDSMITGWCI